MITFDSAEAAADATPGTSTTFSHTCGVGATFLGVQQGTISVSGITFNGDALTKIHEFATNELGQWYLVNPDIVTGDIVITHGNDNMAGGAISLKGTDTTTGVIGALGGQTASTTTTGEVTLTTTRANSWLWGTLQKGSNAAVTESGGGDQTSRFNDSPFGDDLSCYGSTKSTTTVGASTISWSFASAARRTAATEVREPDTGGGAVAQIRGPSGGVGIGAPLMF